jgi:hypothetical protein
MKPFLSGKRSHDAALMRPPHVHKAKSVQGGVRPAAEGPAVEVVKEGDKIVRIVVTCACGEKVEVECLYPAGS